MDAGAGAGGGEARAQGRSALRLCKLVTQSTRCALPKEDFRRPVEKELTGREEEPSELIYFKPTRAKSRSSSSRSRRQLMLGTDKSSVGHCLAMICADFMAGAHLDNSNPEISFPQV